VDNEVVDVEFHPLVIIPREGPKPKRRSIVPVTPAQRWARARNWNKLQLKGIQGQLARMAGSAVITEREQALLASVLINVRALLLDWPRENTLSKTNFLRLLPGLGTCVETGRESGNQDAPDLRVHCPGRVGDGDTG
jgi:hypothetical protein